MQGHTRGTALSATSATLFGASGTFAAAIMTTGWNPIQVTWLRIAAATVLLVPLVLIAKPGALRIRRRDAGLLFGVGFFAVAGSQVFFFIAVSRLPVSIAMLLEFLAPVLVALWIRVVRRTRLRALVWLGIVLAMAGLAMIAQVWQASGLDLLGFAAGLASAVCTAGYFLTAERGATTYRPVALTSIALVVGLVLVSLFSPPWTLPFRLFGASVAFGGGHLPVWLLVLLCGAVSTVLPYLAGMASLRLVSATLASVLGLIEPLVAAITGWLLLGQVLTVVQIAGGVVLLGGALMVQLNSRAPVSELALVRPG